MTSVKIGKAKCCTECDMDRSSEFMIQSVLIPFSTESESRTSHAVSLFRSRVPRRMYEAALSDVRTDPIPLPGAINSLENINGRAVSFASQSLL